VGEESTILVHYSCQIYHLFTLNCLLYNYSDIYQSRDSFRLVAIAFFLLLLRSNAKLCQLAVDGSLQVALCSTWESFEARTYNAPYEISVSSVSGVNLPGILGDAGANPKGGG